VNNAADAIRQIAATALLPRARARGNFAVFAIKIQALKFIAYREKGQRK